MDAPPLLPSTRRTRGAAPRLSGGPLPRERDPALQGLLAETTGADRWLAGGEPTLRPDLLQLLRAAPHAGLRTDAQVLALAGPRRALLDSGLKRIRVPLHAADAALHEWLLDEPGAFKRTLRGLRAAIAVGLAVEGEITITRPGRPHLGETVALLLRLGVRRLVLRRLAREDSAQGQFVTLCPRLGLLHPALSDALRRALRARVPVLLEQVPRCAGALGFPRVPIAPCATAGDCGRCPGAPACPGAPSDYVERFDWTELRSESPAPVRPLLPHRSGAPEPLGDPARFANRAGQGASVPPPPPRAFRHPATRVAVAVALSQEDGLGGDPTRERAALRPPDAVLVDIGADDSARAVRQALVRAAQVGARRLRLSGPGLFAHPQADALLPDATRLSFAEVELCGEAPALAALAPLTLRRLRVEALATPLYAPDAARHDERRGVSGHFDASLAGLAAVAGARRLAAALQPYAVLDRDDEVDDWRAAWTAHAWPTPARFRLAAHGGDLARLAASAPDLPELLRLLPVCLRPEGADDPLQPEPLAAPSRPRPRPWQADRQGAFRACPEAPRCSAAARCPGLAEGWSHPPLIPLGPTRRPTLDDR